MNCRKCGYVIADSAVICPNCGERYAGSAKANYNQGFNQTGPVIKNYNPKFDYTPLGAWGYFGYSLLFSIPFAGFIILVIFALGGTNKINLRNYARSYFCWIVILLVLMFILIPLGVLSTSTFSSIHT